MNAPKRFLPILVALTVLAAAGVAWTELAHRPQAVELTVKGMSCEGCAANITGRLANLPGVSDVVVSHETGQAQLTIDGWSKTTRADVIAAIQAADYEVAE